ncbi:hypothetical protein N7G274_008385 [Stereocaulon virgatum]|uniref:Zn(2)-C6 fungal-type domain-containing protein n=1 Tax=Stereocaulon virgatum TaxID=373712 RepID=A0ABR3ZZP3_9LECA
MVRVVHGTRAATTDMNFYHQSALAFAPDSVTDDPWLRVNTNPVPFAKPPIATRSPWPGQMAFSNAPAVNALQSQPADRNATRHGNNPLDPLPVNQAGCWGQNFAQSQISYDGLPGSPNNTFDDSSPVNSNLYQRRFPSQTTPQLSRITIPEITLDHPQGSSNSDMISPTAAQDSSSANGGRHSSISPGFLQPRFEFSTHSNRSPSLSSSDGWLSPGSIGSWEEVSVDEGMELGPPYYSPQKHQDLGSMFNARGVQATCEIQKFPEMSESSGSLSGEEYGFQHVSAPIGIVEKNESSIIDPEPHFVREDFNIDTGSLKDKVQRRRESHARNNEEVNLIRQAKACIRCQVLRDKCGLGDICITCQNSASTTIYKIPCFRAHLSDAEIYRYSALSFPEGVPRLSLWSSKRSVGLKLYNLGFTETSQKPETRPYLELNCRQFPVVPGIPVTRRWRRDNGERAGIDLPRYAMPAAELTQTAGKIEKLIKAHFKTLLLELQHGRNDIIRCALAEAARHVGSCDALDGALNIAIMTRLVSKSFNIMNGPETLGMTPVDDPTSPYYERIPIPPMLDAQIDNLLMQKMKVQRKQVLSKLKKMIMSHSKQNWFMILLIIIVLLSNIEFLYQNQHDQIERYGKTTDHLNFMMNSWEHGARNLIAHFHAICRGDVPLHMKWDEESQKEAGMSDMDLRFLATLRSLVQSQAGQLRSLAKAGRGSPLVWISALLLPPGAVC